MSSIGELNIANQANFNIDIHARSNQITSNDQFMVGSMTGDGVASSGLMANRYAATNPLFAP